MSEFATFQPRSQTSRTIRANAVEIRAARHDDAVPLSRLIAAREGARPEDVLPHVERTIAQAGDQSLVVVAETHGAVVGIGRVKYFRPPPNAPVNTAPEGWYLFGLIVAPSERRQGIGRALTIARLDWIAERASCAYYFANARNEVSLALHRELGFADVTTDFAFPGASFQGGTGVLCRVALPIARRSADPSHDP
jgi:ribosomal protein S18 acetylase RimI-like enzyme